jgi:hypothetical protein
VVKNDFKDITGKAIQGWGSGKTYYVSGNTFSNVTTTLDISNPGSGSKISAGSTGLTDALAAFKKIYGLDISSK